MNKKGFEAGKSADELGIDTSRKFVIVSRRGDSLFNIGEIISFVEYSVFGPSDDLARFTNGKVVYPAFYSELAYADRTLRDMKVGDTIEKEGYENLEVLEVFSKIFAAKNPYNYINLYEIDALERLGWQLKEEPTLPSTEEQDKAIELLEKAGRIKNGKIIQ